MRVLVIDNYDSFTYNLVQYLGELGAEIEVIRNDKAEVAELLERGADRLVVSPGPRTPAQAGGSRGASPALAQAGPPPHGGGVPGCGDPRLRRGGPAAPRRLPRPPGDGGDLRRQGRPGRADPRQGC